MSGILTNDQVVLIARSAALLADHAPSLSPFERELVIDVGRRFLKGGRLTAVSHAEWDALADIERTLTAAARGTEAVAC